MCDLVARTGRHLQRYEDGRRLVAGCIPFRYRDIKDEQKKLVEGGWENDETVEEAAAREAIEEAGVRGDLVLLFAPMSFGHILLIHGTSSVHKKLLGFYDFKSKQPDGMCRAAVFALLVKEELASWPEQSTRQRCWLTVPEAVEQSRHPWMQEALVTGFSGWLQNWSNGGGCVDRSER
ncbi:hypothetical protein HU200_040800 [Digitaria exilis]|uniref:Nudix hydrolase domain-containing protein n=1 Tax=Digitaria exilis TaxID=1010633 RepID=A0A835BD00_9POAL|nr:hypothetical protein HU200_040800 [Digitaria exilis]